MLDLLKLCNYRNYEYQEIRFSPGVNVILGDNGQGKTNILEAIYYLSLLRSFRTQKVIELCHFGSDEFTIYGEIEKKSGKISLGVSNGQKRKLSVNGILCNLASNFISKYICSAFIPEDLTLVKGSPQNRRRFLDILICQISNDYLHSLQAYTLALHQRNIMLKNVEKYSKNSITAYNYVLIKEGVTIELERRRVVGLLNEAVQEESEKFFSNRESLCFKYLSGCGVLLQDINGDDHKDIEEKFLQALEKNYESDCRNGTTRFGPHRSDFSCLLNARQLSHFGSEGECRTAALSLKLASLKVLYNGIGSEDVTLVVDDVLGELDKEKRNVFFRLLEHAGQVVIACTEIPRELTNIHRIFHIERGKVIDIKDSKN